jgi:hypothetical protein
MERWNNKPLNKFFKAHHILLAIVTYPFGKVKGKYSFSGDGFTPLSIQRFLYFFFTPFLRNAAFFRRAS